MRGKKAARKTGRKVLPQATSGGLAVSIEPLALELYGVIPAKRLSQMILFLREVIDTCRHNAECSPEDRALPRLERWAHHTIGPREFDDFQRAVRPQLHDICEKADRLLKSHAKRGRGSAKAGGHGGIGICVYYDGSVKGVRHRGHRSRE